jgi:hypothetical protein
MLGNPNWFKRRKYSGWGLTPATWQGWAYIGVLLCSIFSVFVLITWFKLQTPYQIGILLCISAFIVMESLDIVTRMDKDERETTHEAFAERNAAWVMAMILGVGIVFQSTVSILQGTLSIDPFIVIALLGGVITKGISNWYYIDK